MSSAEVIAPGWHDTYFRWDLSTPQRVVSRLEQLPGQLRFESEQRFAWRDSRPVAELQNEAAASIFWGSVFGQGTAAGNVTRIEREVQAMRLIERVQLGAITTAQFEQLTGFPDRERLGLTDRVYGPETARRRRALAKSLGVSPADAEDGPLDLSLDQLLEVPRSGWAA